MRNGKRHDNEERKASSKANAKDLYLWWGKLVRRHPERMWRICYRGEESRKLVTRVIDSSLRATLPFPIFPTRHSYLRSEWRFWESTSLTMRNGKRHDNEERKASSKANAKDLYLWWGKLVRRHPERMWRICYRGEESRKLVTRVIDSSLRATLPFPIFPTRHSYLRSEWRFWESTSLTMGNGKRHNDGERKASSRPAAKDLLP